MSGLVVPGSAVAYPLAYGLAALACGIAVKRALAIEDRETRRGLVGLLAGSGAWALLEGGFLIAPTVAVASTAYTGSLIVGLSTVGAWLYFCSAYTGRTFHRNGTVRRAAVLTYVAIVALKLTNPVHGVYFVIDRLPDSVLRFTVQYGRLHWLVAGLSYALVAVGFFMLYETLSEADYDTRPLAGIVALSGLPVLFDVVGFASPYLLDINYEPLGVAAFALGALYVFQNRFLTVQLTDGVDDAVVHLDDEGRILVSNGAARERFPELRGRSGDSFRSVLPDAAACLDGDDAILERDREGEKRYYFVSETAFEIDQSDLGRMVVFADVSELEHQRRELQRHNEQLEQFAAAIRHELLNRQQVIAGQAEVAGDALEEGDVRSARDALRTISRTVDRTIEVVEDLAGIARYGQTMEDTVPVAFGDIVEAAFDAADGEGIELSVRGGGAVEADPGRLRELFDAAFAFAAQNADSEVTVTLDDDAIVIADDGEPVSGDPDDFFEYGTVVSDTGTSLHLSNLRMLARIHGWETDLDTGYDDGTRIVVGGVDVLERTDVRAAGP